MSTADAAMTAGKASDDARDGSLATGTYRAELRSWALLGGGALAVAGVFAFLLALSRLPGIERFIHWPLEFFSKGLVIHVVFSLVIWFLTVFALLVSFAAEEVSEGRDMRLAGIGRIGLALAAMSFPLLFLPAFHETSRATLNNYVPVIIHPGYYLGLVMLALGILMPVVRLLANVVKAPRPMSPLATAMTSASVVYCVALVSFALGLKGVWGEEPSRLMHEHLFWGGGHVLQFIYALLMLTGWFVLAQKSLQADIVDPDIFRIAVRLIGVFALPAIMFYVAFPAFSLLQTEAFRRLQFVLAFPALLIAVGGLSTVLRYRRAAPLPWHDPAFVAMVLSAAVFAAGGIMGLLITTSDTRTPAHYHGVIAGVNLACMGLVLRYVLPALKRPVAEGTRVRLQLALFGAGQLMASIGLFLAGGYGAPRKTPSGSVNLVDGAVVGLYLHGFGALFAVVGGIMFVLTLLRALLKPGHAAPHTSQGSQAVDGSH